MSESDITSAMHAAMSAENGRRLLASQRPGFGASVPLEQPPSGAGVGISDVDMPIIGEGYAAPSALYAADVVGGYNFLAGRQEAPVRRHVADLGADGLFIEDYPGTRPSGPVTVVSPPSRPSLLGRLLARIRGR